MADIYKIAAEWMGIWVHSGPGTVYGKTGVIYGKDKKEYKVTDKKNKYWLKLEGVGWCCDRDGNGTIVLKKIKTEDSKKVKVEAEKKKEEVDEESYAYVPTHDIIKTLSAAEFNTELENNFAISNIRGIFGMPYQFMSSADPRIETTNKSDSIGRKYAKEIVSSLPILLITPGKPVFMGKYSDKDRETILKQFIGAAAGKEEELKETVFSKDFGKYYSLEYAYDEYFNYVTPMCRIASRVMNLQDEVVDGEKLESADWSKSVNKSFTKLFSVYRGCTAWYCDSATSISDSFSNSTTQSSIASKINSLSDYGRELNFLLGTVKTETGVALDKFTNAENLTDNMQNVDDFVSKMLGNNGFSGVFSSITNSAQTVVAGGKLVFPEIWSESEFSRSYNINLKLVSPDGDDLSVYLNIIVPMLHLLALVLPREADKSHGYISPFLVRAFYKGMFNVDMGIITDLTFTKGKESAWTASGVPTVVEVDMTIKDLYNDLYMTNMDGIKYNLMNNIMLMDYISNMCGVNINEVDVYRAIDLFLIQNVKNRITDIIPKTQLHLDQWISNKWQNLFGRF